VRSGYVAIAKSKLMRRSMDISICATILRIILSATCIRALTTIYSLWTKLSFPILKTSVMDTEKSCTR
jgi:hypothetical protein